MIYKSASAIILFLWCFSPIETLDHLAPQLQAHLQQVLSINPELNDLKTKLEVSKNGFIRFTQTFKNGKQQYQAVNLSRFLTLSYLGTANFGFIVIKTAHQDVIFQTYHDPKGDLDSMAGNLTIPAKTIQPEQLDQIDNELAAIQMLLTKSKH